MQNTRTNSKNPVLSKMTAYLFAANLISNYSIRTAYYAVTKKEGPCSAVEIPCHKAADFPKCVSNMAVGTRAIDPLSQSIVASGLD